MCPENTGLQVKVTVQPVIEPVTRAQAKNFIKSQLADAVKPLEDDLIDDMIKTARRLLEGLLGISIMTQTRQMFYETHSAMVKVVYGPVQTITLVQEQDDQGNTALIEGTDYRKTGLDDPILHFKEIMSVSKGYYQKSLLIEYVAGVDDVDDVPVEIRTAMLMQVATDYEYRQDIDEGGLQVLSSQSKSKVMGLSKINEWA